MSRIYIFTWRSRDWKVLRGISCDLVATFNHIKWSPSRFVASHKSDATCAQRLNASLGAHRLIKECWSRRLRCIRLMQLVQPSRHEYNFMPIYELHSLRVRVRSPCGDTFLVYARAYKLADPAHRARLSRQSRRQLLSFARWLLQAPACLTHSKLAVYNSACWA